MRLRRRRAAGRTLAWAAPVIVSLAGLGLAACASTDDGAISLDARADAPPASDSVLDRPSSEGTVEVGDTFYRFAVTCYAPGAGDLLVLGVGDDPASDRFVELYLQAYVGDPYIGLRLGDGTLIESALDGALDLYFQDDVIRASAIRFVEGLDLGTGEATQVGFGELEVFCSDFSEELPPSGA